MWTTEMIPGACHVTPVNDIIQHTLSDDCICGPRVEWINPDTGSPYANGCLVIHNSADQREAFERHGMTIDRLIEILNGYKIPFANEAKMQIAVEKILRNHGITHYREFAFTPKDRIDFLVGDVVEVQGIAGAIGVECKVDGSKHSVARQLLRYAERPEIGSLLLITSRATHTFPSNVLLGKEFRVYRISGL